MWLDVTPDQFEFEGVDGIVHTFAGMSVSGVFEFEARLGEIGAIIQANPDRSAQESYQRDKRFRFLIDRALQLNHIKPAWVCWSQVEAFLFGSWDEATGEAVPPLLLSIQPQAPQSDRLQSNQPATLEAIIGQLSTVVDFKTAMEMVQNLTPAQLSQILAARSEATEAPEDKLKRNQRNGLEKRRQEMAQRYAQDPRPITED